MGIDFNNMSQKAVFLDRDGVLNNAIIRDGKPFSPRNVSELTIPDDVLSALGKLKAAGFLLIGATNQPDVARGDNTIEAVEAINKKLMAILPLDEIYVCYHDDADQCQCRKPLPGLITDAAIHHDVDLTASFMVGDRWKDVEAGQRAGCKTVWLNQGYQEQAPKHPANFTATSLTQAADWIIDKS